MTLDRPTVVTALHRHGLMILRNSLIVSVVVGAASFLIRDKYTASSVVLPPQYGSDAPSVLSSVSGAVPLSRMLGLETGNGTDLYVGVLRSDTINHRLVQRFDLMRVYHQKDVEKAGKKLAAHTSIQLTNDGFVRVAVTEPDRGLAAGLANAYVEELDRFLRVQATGEAGRRRAFLERRIADTRDTLTRGENALTDYQIRHKVPVVGADVERSAQAASELMAEKVSREVELGTLETVAQRDNPRAQELRAQLRQIDYQLVRIPPATTDLARLFRGLRMKERVLLVLTEEYERARVLEMKNIPTVQVVDRAGPPLHKSRPRRLLIAAAALALAIAGNTMLVWAREGALRSA